MGFSKMCWLAFSPTSPGTGRKESSASSRYSAKRCGPTLYSVASYSRASITSIDCLIFSAAILMDPNLLFRAILASPFSRFRASISRLAFSATSTRSYRTCLFWLVSAILFAIAYHLSGCFNHDSGSSTIYVYKFIYFYKTVSLGSNYSTAFISWARLSSNFWDIC